VKDYEKGQSLYKVGKICKALEQQKKNDKILYQLGKGCKHNGDGNIINPKIRRKLVK